MPLLLQIVREITLVRAGRTLFLPIVTVIGIPAAVISLVYLLIGVDPRPFVGAFLGDALDSSLTTIGICMLVWLAYAVIYSFMRCLGSPQSEDVRTGSLLRIANGRRAIVTRLRHHGTTTGPILTMNTSSA